MFPAEKILERKLIMSALVWPELLTLVTREDPGDQASSSMSDCIGHTSGDGGLTLSLASPLLFLYLTDPM